MLGQGWLLVRDYKDNEMFGRKNTEHKLSGLSSTSLEANLPERGPTVGSRRTLLKAAWIAPVIVPITLPRSGYAANISSSHRPSEPKSNNGNHFGQSKKDS